MKDTNSKLARRSRHGRNAPDQIKLSCKVDLETWRRVGKAAEAHGADVAAFLRGVIAEAVRDVTLTKADHDEITRRIESRE